MDNRFSRLILKNVNALVTQKWFSRDRILNSGHFLS
jgi:hypothetical protein